MSSKNKFLWAILLTIFLPIPCLFSGEIYRWTDEKGTLHFTDDESKIPGQYSDQAERVQVREEILQEVEKINKPEEGPDPVKDYLRKIEDYEKEDYQYYQPFKDRRTGKWIPVASPLYEEKRRLKAKIEALKVEIKRIQESLSMLMRNLWKIITY